MVGKFTKIIVALYLIKTGFIMKTLNSNGGNGGGGCGCG